MWAKCATQGETMKTLKKLIAIGTCGIVIGVGLSVMGTAPATARIYAGCDKKITNMENQAAKAYAKGRLSADDYARIQAEIAYHRQLWGC